MRDPRGPKGPRDPRGHRRIRLAAAASAALLMAGLGLPRVAEADTATSGEAAAAPAAGSSATVRLVTGDSVTVTATGDGRRTASVEPGPGRENMAFQTIEHDGRITVLPADVVPLFATGAIDPTLFEVTALVERGYDTAHADALPLLVHAPEGPTAAAADRRMDALAALHDGDAPSYELDSIDATSLRVAGDDLGDFWERLDPPARMSRAQAAATPRVWLDATVSATLDRSTRQVNAPAAWDAGLDGEGVTVAVLDTGVDADHPDLAGRISAAQDFSGSGGTHDAYGHGTHVAATVGGTGAASAGARQGLAPAADLIVGKVLGDDGQGSLSQVIAGMEWATEQGADVVNLSLGSDEPSDGTDPLSQALNELTETTGTLFVVASGNAGEQGDETIGSPAAADRALTVGAVDRDDALAPFSSRGPRPGDAAVKPDITAPGVDIVAARAEGTAMGTPVDEEYTSASGTSMATPHVAGAAALLAQAHPDWDAERLRSALVSTARTVPDTAVTEQGGGRLDVGAAATGTVTATGTVALGPFAPDDGSAGDGSAAAETRTLDYTNTGDAPVTLRLDAALATDTGEELPEGALRLAAGEVTVAPGATAQVELTADPADVPYGRYYGYVTATAAGGETDGEVLAHTTVSLVVAPPTHRLDVTVLGPDGEPQPNAVPLFWGPSGFVHWDGTSGDASSSEVTEGTYIGIDFGQARGEDGLPEYRMAVLPEVTVTEDTAATLDLSDVTPVEIRTPRPAESRSWLSFHVYRQIEGHDYIGYVQYPAGARLMVTPTEEVTEGEFEFVSRWHLTAPLLTADVRHARLDLDPYYMPYSPLLDPDGERLEVVDAGTAADPDFSAAAGALAVLRGEPSGSWDLMERAAAAGVAAVMTVASEGQNPVTRWLPNGARFATPLMRVSTEQGEALLARVAERPTTVAFEGTVRSPYAYDVAQVSRDRIPERVVHTVTDRNTAELRTTYAETGASDYAMTHQVIWRPYQSTAIVDPPIDAPTGLTRTEYVSSGDTTWQRFTHYTVPWLVDLPVDGVAMRDDPRAYRSSDRLAQEWFGAVVRPAIPAGGAVDSVRERDTMTLRIPEFADSGSDAGQWSSGGSADGVLYRDGAEVGAADGGWGSFAVPPGEAAYRFDLNTSRSGADWLFGTATETSWDFVSGSVEEETPLPLLQVDYEVRADEHNAVDDGRRHTIGLDVRHQDGLAAPEDVTLEVEVSYDDGATFVPAARVREHDDNRFTATLERPAEVDGEAYVTLRVTATDAAGNRVRQTVERAYLDRG
ncbi:S8 family serine peptidase [Streptomyces sp. B6B3]|uniref:S8 family serine peptidase n=1 Tax=Streptomyces sp. B6B3 TaxID=3153570 RepID=UPI00325F143E